MPLWLSITVVLVAFYVVAAVVSGPFLVSLDIISRRLKLPSSVAGATLLALGTSAPEISTALVALFAEGRHAATGVGSIVGSAIFQILVVIGFAAAVRASTLDWRPVLRDSIAYAMAVALLAYFAADDRFTQLEASLLVGSYGLYLGVMWLWTRYGHEDVQLSTPVAPPRPPASRAVRMLRSIVWPIDRMLRLIPDPEHKPRWTLPVFAVCLAVIGYACYWLVAASEALAHALAVPPVIIALTVLAGGSSIPELVSSATVSRQGRGDMAIANAIGSNIFDVLISLGLPVLLYCSLYGDLEGIGGGAITGSITLLFGTLVVVVGLLAVQRFRVGRAFGSTLILAYALYVLAAYLGWV
ncbi:MAG: sodium:calcium antiporter [Myxococcota bacterium]